MSVHRVKELSCKEFPARQCMVDVNALKEFEKKNLPKGQAQLYK